ncbi:MAG TPA: DUF1360 domain-containing protein [Cryptosporangiaceae bacterium]|nr:DUF1360 domain-containing protein [Cryptosporangiaceae bacterium]
MSGPLTRVAHQVKRSYAGTAQRPLGGYLAVLGTYAGVVGTLSGAALALGRRPPERVPAGDLVLFSVATHKLSRLLAKDSILSPLRAPFTGYQEPAGEGELNEEVRGQGVRHAVGELVTCPFCVGVWIATGFFAGTVFAPRMTRLVAGTFAAVAGADMLHLGYDAAKEGVRKLSS